MYKPKLADANVKFTPLAMRMKNEVYSPAHFLRIEDLETPKRIPSQEMIEEEFEEPAIDTNEVREALLLVINYIDQVESKQKKTKAKKEKSFHIQPKKIIKFESSDEMTDLYGRPIVSFDDYFQERLERMSALLKKLEDQL